MREIAAKSMIEATAQSRLNILNRTQTRRGGRKYKYSTGDLVDVFRKPEGVHAKDTSGWRGPDIVCDISSITEGTLGVRCNGKTLLTSIECTRPPVAYHVLLIYIALAEPDYASRVRGAAQAAKGSINVYAWMNSTQGWKLSQRATDYPTIFNACIQLGVTDLHITGCIGPRVGKHVDILTPYPSADGNVLI